MIRLTFMISLCMVIMMSSSTHASAQTEPQTTRVIGEGRHVVAKKQTLYRIARKYKLTVDELKAMNGLTSDNLEIGQELIVKPGKQVISYVVQPGETLFAIAQAHNTKFRKIMRTNRIKSVKIHPGQELLIEQE